MCDLAGSHMSGQRAIVDPLTQASVTIAWVILLNKPFYPLYVWYLAGNGVIASLASLTAAPLYLAIPLIAHRSPLAARVALPLVGTLDTLFETKLFGQGAGTELFFAACIMLGALSFRDQERWWQRAVSVLVFGAFVIARIFAGSPLYHWSDQDLAAFFNLNAFAAASLTTFIALRYAGSRDLGT